jgi:NADH-quinone oxidoreductase subunit I
VRSDDPSLKRLTPPKLTLGERTYLPQIAEGLLVTGRHIAGVVLGGRGNPGVLFGGKGHATTVEYPEDQHIPSANYRGVHRLNKDENGRIKCVACMLCATACPAHCIDIVGATAPETWDDREKYPESFVIDELRCIYCGMCEEACPVDAIELTGLYDLTGLSREQMIFDKAKLLSVFDVTKDAEPMRTGNPLDASPASTQIEPSVAPGPRDEAAAPPPPPAQGPTP